MWDFILANGSSGLRTNHDSAKLSPWSIKSIYGTVANPVMRDLLAARSSRITYGLHPYYCDLSLLPDYRERLSLLHAMAHSANHDKPVPSSLQRQYTRFAEDMLQAAADVAVARTFGLPLRLDGAVTRLPYGLVACYCAKYDFGHRQPLIWFPAKIGGRQLLDQVFAVVCVAVEIGPPPIEFVIPGHEPDPLNAWWSFQPVRTMVLGWETMDWMFGQEIASLVRYNIQDKTRLGFTALVQDTLPAHTLAHYLEEARSQFGQPSADFVPLDRLQSLEPCVTPPLPCPLCAVFPYSVDSTLAQPSGVPPRTLKKDPVWAAYVKELKKVFRSIAKAKSRYDGNLRRRMAVVMRKQWIRHCRTVRNKHRMANKW